MTWKSMARFKIALSRSRVDHSVVFDPQPEETGVFSGESLPASSVRAERGLDLGQDSASHRSLDSVELADTRTRNPFHNLMFGKNDLEVLLDEIGLRPIGPLRELFERPVRSVSLTEA